MRVVQLRTMHIDAGAKMGLKNGGDGGNPAYNAILQPLPSPLYIYKARKINAKYGNICGI